MKMQVKEYKDIAAYEADESRQDYEVISIVGKPNGCVCADLMTGCKRWQTAVNRFFAALEGDSRFDGWREWVMECIKDGVWSDKMADIGGYIPGGWFWEVDDYDGSFYVCLNVIV